MIIQIDDVKSYASNLLKVLESQRVNSVQDLETLINKGYTRVSPPSLYLVSLDGVYYYPMRAELEGGIPVGRPSLDLVSFDKRPSNSGTMAYAIDYIRPEGGIPIEIRINNLLNYSKVFIKSQQLIKGYAQFGIDHFRNLRQEKLFKSSDISFVKNELTELSKL